MNPMQRELYFKGNWKDPKTIRDYENGRKAFRGCAAKIVRATSERHLQPSGKLVEVGSGFGELLLLAPELNDRLIQIEQSPAIATENRKIHQDSTMVVADAHHLPFEDRRFEGVIGFASYDTFDDLPGALREARRILLPRGRFIHFLDMVACGNPLFFIKTTNDQVVFPALEILPNNQKALTTRVLVVTKKEAQRVLKQLPHPGFVLLFSSYLSNPIETYDFLLRQRPDILKHMAGMLEMMSVKGETISFSEFFKDNLTAALRLNGFTIQVCGEQYAEEVMAHARELTRFGKEGHNSFSMNVGIGTSRYDPQLPDDAVKVRLTMQVIVAERTD